ncbi:MAG: peptide ABC transporter substrate-binding protein [Clostridia bacterium]|nr:peptide ABC transporter substrate-binding protein [Clostridia bacterium]
MFKRVFAAIITLVMVLTLFSSCSSGEGEDLYYPIYSDPVSFDPQIASDNASKIVVFNCFEGLVRLDKDGKIVSGVAKSWEISPDGTVYTFHLKQNAKWYMSEYAKELLDEKTAAEFKYNVIADDFVYGLQRAFDKNMGASTDTRLFAIRNAYEVYDGEKSPEELGVTAINDTTLQIELDEASDDFLKALTQTAAMPCRKEFFEATKGRYGLDPEKVIYNGPFYLYSWTTGVNLSLHKNENYSESATVSPSIVYLYVNDDLQTRVDKLSNGTYDACPLTVSQKNAVDNDKVSYINYNNSTWGFAFNCSSETMKNRDLRSALTTALDVSSIPLPEHCKSYANGIVPDICLIGNAVYRGYAGKKTYPASNPSKAKVHLEKAFKALEMDNITINIICHQDFDDSVKIAVQKWQSTFGIEVNFVIEKLDEMALEKRVSNGEYDVAFTRINAQSDSASAFLGMFTTSGKNNIFFMKSKTYDALMGAKAEHMNQQEIISNCIQAEEYLISRSVVIPVFADNSYMAMAKNVSGVYAIEAGTIPIFKDGMRK